MPDVSRAVFDALLPPGAIWIPATSGDFDLLLDGIAENSDETQTFLASLADLRNPQKTTLLNDLEKEYGIIADDKLTEQERRDRLSSTKSATAGDGTAEYLEDKLRSFGFDVYVYNNDPPVDPDIFSYEGYLAYSDGNTAYCGHESAVCGGIAGELIVNGDILIQKPLYLVRSGKEDSLSGKDKALCGYFEEMSQKLFGYIVPDNPGYWPMVFFVGGIATRDPVTNELVNINIVFLDEEKRDEIVRLIIKYKPLHSWCVLVAAFT